MAYITEVDPTWQSDLLSTILYPETLLFANPMAQLACISDSVSANLGRPLAPEYWCMGSWGNTYPMTGNIGDQNAVEASLGVGARMIYKMARFGSICDTGLNLCTCIPTPIWYKSNYRFACSKPIVGFQDIPIGRTSMIWGAAKNPPLGGTSAPDNFLYTLFRLRTCCAF